MRKFLTSILLLAAVFATAGCEKIDDGVDGMVEIFAESMTGSKVVLDGVNATWKSGDEIRLNGTTATVERREGHAYISADALTTTNRALYPASLGVANWGTDNPTVTFPAYYHYRTDGNGHQVLDLPMAAYSTSSSNPLQFKHLTGALYITVKNTASVPLKLLSVTVTSSSNQLSGPREVNINTFSINPSIAPSTDDKTVSLVFDSEYTLKADSSIRVMLPILPVASSNRFTIKVKSYADGQSSAYLYSNTQPSGGDHSLARNQLGYAPVEINASGSTTFLDKINGNYVVRTPKEFVLMTEGITNGTILIGENVDILDDIDMTGYPISPINKAAYVGTIDGHGHTISNITINSLLISTKTYVCGLLGRGDSPTIQNLTMSQVTLNYPGVSKMTLFAGGLVGQSEPASGRLTISNCHVTISQINNTGEANMGTIYFGGLAGDAKEVDITNCSVAVPSLFTISGATIYYGGLFGSISSGTTTITSSSWTGTANLTSTAITRAGGLIGSKGGGNLTAKTSTVSGSMIISSSGSYHYYGAMIGRYNQGGSTVDTADNHINVTITENGNPFTVVPFN